MKTALIHSDAWQAFDYGPEHPLRMERLGLTWRLIEAYGLTRLPDAIVRVPESAPEADILGFHRCEYLDVLKAADGGRLPREGPLFGLGPGDNPVFPGMWHAARLVAGGSIMAADLVASGTVDRAFHFAGGLHHAMPAHASGFCYVNDAVLAILRLCARGLRVAYVDIDAHHGDGVQFAFYNRADVLTISTHERGDRLFPGTGFVEETGDGSGVGYAVNLPLEAFTDTSVYLPAFDAVVPPLVAAFRPDVIVAQLGADGHRTDPLTHLALDIQGFAAAIRRILQMCPRVVALGGGGYDLQNVARAWTVAWALLNDVTLPDELPPSFESDARRFEFTTRTLWDPPEELPEDRQRWVRDYANRQVDAIQRLIFPLHGL